MTVESRPREQTARSTDGGGGRRPRWLAPLLLRLHFYAGVLVGPFILVAALSGATYALTPALEQVIYDRELHVPATATTMPLATQVQAAEAVVGDTGELVAVRPAPNPGETTRVMFTGEGLVTDQTRAIFVDPADASVVGDLPVYGTSGVLPLRTSIDQFHRSLGLGDVGRVYSELAASWMGVVALAGAGLWLARWRRVRSARAEMLRPNRRARGYRRTLSWHSSIGVWVLAGALFLSATGITWSKWAGANVTDLRTALSWGTPSLTTDLPTTAPDTHAPTGGEHAGHHDSTAATPHDPAAPNPALFDDVLRVAQTVNVNTGLVEIRPPKQDGTAWTVTEIQRSHPTEVDAVAIDPTTLEVTDRIDFADFPLPAKLARWGIDIHMGTMFGLINQLVMASIALAITAMVVLGYRMWWQRRPTTPPRLPRLAPAVALTRPPWWGIGLAVVIGAAVGTFLPLVGAGLIGFILIDVLVTTARARRRS